MSATHRKYALATLAPKIDYLKEDNFAEWYKEVLMKSDMIDHTETYGSYILKPASYKIWSRIQNFINEHMSGMGVQNFSFPLLPFDNPKHQSQDDGTKTRNTNRPTPESIIYPYFKQWIKSHWDLPFRLNQWNTGFKWEQDPLPLLRDREFLQQEAHTAHLTQQDASYEIQEVIDFYVSLYQDILAVPVLKGRKSRRNSKADDIDNTIIMAYIPTTGKCIDGAVARGLGQKINMEHKITVNDPSTKEDPAYLHVWQNTWTLSTRAIGLMTATHSDNRGLIVPPRVAPIHMVIIPNRVSQFKDSRKAIEEVDRIISRLRSVGVHATLDLQENHSPGFRLYE
ncbi:prolyl-tRNA synthetase [Aspergillus sclerotialis]|uniref:Prolyl-tRNA synthetase n=1 Tax=Aspergillus sclerotialis TaxID=2070753 RepID=A0A3A2ZUG2_9EURO|nr:prolyl-tRNA synthetase [Aspergillus sclerotialis]